MRAVVADKLDIGASLYIKFAGFAFDLTHNYTLPILASAAANGVAALIVAAMMRSAPTRELAVPE